MKHHLVTTFRNLIASNLFRLLLTVAGFLIFLWPYFAVELFRDIQFGFTIYFILLAIGVLNSLIISLSEEASPSSPEKEREL